MAQRDLDGAKGGGLRYDLTFSGAPSRPSCQMYSALCARAFTFTTQHLPACRLSLNYFGRLNLHVSNFFPICLVW
jgi:hypothetical protein